MTAVGQIEKRTQGRVVALFHNTPNRNFQIQLPKPNEQTAITTSNCSLTAGKSLMGTV